MIFVTADIIEKKLTVASCFSHEIWSHINVVYCTMYIVYVYKQ